MRQCVLARIFRTPVNRIDVNYCQNHYSKILHIFRHDFAPENILILLQEELSKNEAKTIESLCHFLHINVPQPERRGLISRGVGLSNLGVKVVRAFNKFVVNEQEISYKKASVKKFVLTIQDLIESDATNRLLPAEKYQGQQEQDSNAGNRIKTS